MIDEPSRADRERAAAEIAALNEAVLDPNLHLRIAARQAVHWWRLMMPSRVRTENVEMARRMREVEAALKEIDEWLLKEAGRGQITASDQEATALPEG